MIWCSFSQADPSLLLGCHDILPDRLRYGSYCSGSRDGIPPSGGRFRPRRRNGI